MRAVSEGLVYVSDAYVKAVQEKDGKMTVIGIDIENNFYLCSFR